MTPADHECSNKERLLQLEKKVTEVETTTKYIHQELDDLKTAIKECTRALNDLSNKITIEESNTNNAKWFIPIGLTILAFFLGRIL